MLIDTFDHDKTHRTWAGDLYNRPVDPADMIAQQQYTTGGRNILDALNINFITLAEQTLCDKTQQGLWHFTDGIDAT